MSNGPTTPLPGITDRTTLARLLQTTPRPPLTGNSRVVETRTGSVLLLQRPQRARRPDASATHAGEEAVS